MRLLIAFLVVLTVQIGVAKADETPAGQLRTEGWPEYAISHIESEASSDVEMIPEIPAAVSREWRTFDSEGSAKGVLVALCWVVASALVALLAEFATARALSRRVRRRIAAREEGARLADVLGLLLCDVAGLAVFVVVFGAAQRHFLPALGVTTALGTFTAAVLVRWRATVLIIRAILRPRMAAVRLIEVSDAEARHQAMFLSAVVLVVTTLIGFNRYGLMDEDNSAAHVVGLISGVLVCGIYSTTAIHVRRVAEALIRGRRSAGIIAGLREAIARAWVPISLTLIAGLFLTFVAGLSLGLLAYYRAVSSTVAILFVVLVIDRLLEWDLRDAEKTPLDAATTLVGHTLTRILRAIALVVAVMLLAWIWIGAMELSEAAAIQTRRSIAAAVGTLFVAYVAWSLCRLAIDRHLHTMGGPVLPGDDDDAGTPASRLQTILPLLRAFFAVAIAVLAVLIALSRLGVDTAPLIAGAGVFGLAVSFGSQALVRDVISGLFYMWDDAFRVGEYIDSGRLKGTVENLGIRSVRLRHQNGPLHTIPYGQLGAVTNLSRDFATIKFNLRFDPHTDIDLVRRIAKQIGLAVQDDNPEMAAEILQPLKLQGIAEVVDNALVLRFKFTALPLKPSWVQREYLKRMYKAFAEKGVAFASGAVMLQTVPSQYPDAPETDKADKAASPPTDGNAAAAAAALAVGVVAGAEVAALADSGS
jgi:small-conductance mechanosensitive channel